MGKKNKLYTANRWNQPLFALGVDRVHQNIFDGLMGSTLNTPTSDDSWWNSQGLQWYQAGEAMDNKGAGTSFAQAMPQGYSPSASTLIGATGPQASPSTIPNLSDTFLQAGLKQATERGNKEMGAGSKSMGNIGQKAETMKALTGVGLEMTGLIGRSEKNPNGLWDIADPTHYLARGMESSVGNGLGSAGIGLFKSGAQSGNGYMMLAGAGLKVAGSLTNAAFGTKVDKKRLNAVNSGINYLNNFNSNASSIDEIKGPNAITSNTNGIYKGGWFTSGKAKRKNADLRAEVNSAQSWANRSIGNNINNIEGTQMDNLLGNYAAFGGMLGSQNTGAIDYDFMSDYLLSKDKATRVKDKTPNNVFGSLANAPIFALGGDIQNHGADFTTGLAEINAGGSHEDNPYDGVQVGISRENGQPNLVEEGETIFNDYVFSKRINVDDQTKKRFHLGRNAKISYADLSKRLQKESLERPNDPISQAALRKQMQTLSEEQERQKSEIQARKMQAAFEALPPEQQQAIMQQMALDQQKAQQQQAQQAEQQQMEQQNAEQQPVMEEGQQQPDERQMMDAQMQQQMQPQMQEQMSAYGGRVNRFGDGGATNAAKTKRTIYSMLPKVYTDSDFAKWTKDNKITTPVDWDNIQDNQEFLAALGKQNQALADAIAKGYDFGNYVAPTDKYKWDSFKEKLAGYDKSKSQGNLPGNYVIDKDFDLGKYSTIQELENSPAYKNYTQYLIDAINRSKGVQVRYKGEGNDYGDLEFKDPDRKFSEDDYKALKFLQAHMRGTATNPNGDAVPLWTTDNDGYMSLVKDADTLVNRYRTDGKGGIFHFTPEENKRGNITTNYIINPDGTVETMESDVPEDWKNVGKYSWADEQNDNTAIYYKRPEEAAEEEKEKTEENEYKPVHKPSWMRYAGTAGPLVGLAMQAAGVGKYDSSLMGNAEAAASMSPVLAQYKPIGDYLRYRPMDIWQQQIMNDATSRATDRALLNNSASVGTQAAGLVANGLNTQIADNDLRTKALEYNEAQRQKVADFNRATNMFNADAFTKTSIANADNLSRNRQFKAQALLDIARQQAAADASWYKGIYGNVQSYFKGLSDMGRENEQHNMIADMAADGLFGTMSDKQYSGKGFLRKKKIAAKGGKINRKKK